MAASVIESLLGPSYILLCLTFILYGLFCAQTFYYWMTYKDSDFLVLRLWTILLCVLVTLHTACCIHFSYVYFIVNFDNPVALSKVTWSAALAACIECTISGIVQSYYSWRIWRLQHSVPAVFILFVVQVVRLAIGYKSGAEIYAFREWQALLNDRVCKVYAYLYFSSNLGVDTLIASLLVFCLYKARSSAQRSTRKIILKLTYYAIAAGAPTVIGSMAQLITFSIGGSITWAGLSNMNAQLYANSMLVMLNARRIIARTTESNNGYSVELPRIVRSDTVSRSVIEILPESIAVKDPFGAEEHFPRTDKSDLRPNELPVPEDYNTV